MIIHLNDFHNTTNVNTSVLGKSPPSPETCDLFQKSSSYWAVYIMLKNICITIHFMTSATKIINIMEEFRLFCRDSIWCIERKHKKE